MTYRDTLKQIAEQLMDAPPGVRYIEVQHDLGCPGIEHAGQGCDCNPDFVIQSPDEFVASVQASRQQRRAAARAAEKALAKVKGGKQ
jgi:hypothetical protein